MKKNEAQKHYEEAVELLCKYCDKETDLIAEILANEYPFRVKFSPDYQLSIFDERVDTETGEIKDPGELTITVGMTTAVKSTLKFKMDSKQLKKIMRLAEVVGNLYYQAFREQAGDLRADNELDGMLRSVLESTEA